MKVKDLIEAIETANKVYKRKHGHDMEIFDLKFDDGDEGTMEIEASKKVIYKNDEFVASKTGKTPCETIDIYWSVEDGEIVDRCVEIRK